MATEKHIIITGTSDVSWKDAIVQTISEASKTLDYISSIKVLDQRANVTEDKITKYFVDLDLSFTIDSNRKDN